jgi:predicted  nucleic acid-binding Zn-ribbon protein
MNKIFTYIWKGLLALFSIASIFLTLKNKEIRDLNKVIKTNKKKEKTVKKEIAQLEVDKKANKKEIEVLKADLENTKKEIEEMQIVYEEDDVEAAIKFLKDFANG